MQRYFSKIFKKGSNSNWGLLILFCLSLQGCVSGPVPVEEYALARAAIEAARNVEASRYAPGYWSQADEAYRRAKILLSERENEEARVEFLRARLAAERAENSARYIRFKNGEVL